VAVDLWQRCGAEANLRRISGRAWRVVEGQHVISTRKLVDSAEEQGILEELIDGAKPPYPDDDDRRGLHYLLATPFRYPPLRHGSRFGTRDQRSIWYGSSRARSALAETAYYRLLFLEGTSAEIAPLVLELSAFRVPYRSPRGVDLCRPPFDAYHERIASPLRYDEAQRLGRAMRDAGVHAFRYPSARDGAGGVNVGLFAPRAFAAKLPEQTAGWSAVLTRRTVEFVSKDLVRPRRVQFSREQFEVDGRLPSPAL
jgi:hypothetical protein